MDKNIIPATRMRKECLGGISDMTLWRWLNDPKLNFPKPIYIAKRRYWREAEVQAWIDNDLAEKIGCSREDTAS